MWGFHSVSETRLELLDFYSDLRGAGFLFYKQFWQFYFILILFFNEKNLQLTENNNKS